MVVHRDFLLHSCINLKNIGFINANLVRKICRKQWEECFDFSFFLDLPPSGEVPLCSSAT